METSLFQKILETNLINFLIVISTLVWIFKKAHLGSLIQKMADDIKSNVEESNHRAESALKEYEETKEATKGVEELQKKIIKQAEINAQCIKEKIEQKTTLKQEDIRTNLRKAFERQEEKYKNLTVDEVYIASIELAKEEILKRLDKNVHKKLINSSIDELNNLEGSIS